MGKCDPRVVVTGDEFDWPRWRTSLVFCVPSAGQCMLPTHYVTTSSGSASNASPQHAVNNSSRLPPTLFNTLYRRARAAALKRARKHLRRNWFKYSVAVVICCSVVLTLTVSFALSPATTGSVEADYTVRAPPAGATPPPLLQPPAAALKWGERARGGIHDVPFQLLPLIL